MGPEPYRRSALPLIGVFAFLLVLGATLVLSAEDVSADRLRVPDRYPTIQQAVDNATAGDEVIIRAGSYNESVKVTKPITLTRFGEGETIITSDEVYVLHLQGNGITVSFLTIVGNSSNNGIYCNQFSDGLIERIQIRNCSIGMLLSATYDSEIRRASIEDCDVGIRAKNGTYGNHFEELTLHDNQIGIDVGRFEYLYRDSDNYFTLCELASNQFGAMIGPNGPDNTFFNCRFGFNGETALSIGAGGCLVDNCVIYENGYNGISLNSPGTVVNSIVTSNGNNGIEIVGTSGCILTNISFYSNLGGVYLHKANQATLSKLYGSDNYEGIKVSGGSYGVTLSESDFVDCSWIALTIERQSEDVTVRSCNFAGSYQGMLISQSKKVLVTECTFSSNLRSGVQGVDSYQIQINRSSIILTRIGHGLEFFRCRGVNIVDCILNNNDLSGISFTKWDYQGQLEMGISDCLISGSGWSGIFLDKVTGITITGNTIENNGGGGIDALMTLRSTVTDNIIQLNAFGIALNGSQDCILARNTIRRNDQEGIRLVSSGSGIGNEIRYNLITENSWRSSIDLAGILLSGKYTQNNIVAMNEILSNPVGIRFESYTDGCKNNMVYQNTIRSCNRYGIGTKWNAGPNTVYLNYLISNEEHVNGVHIYDKFDLDRLGNYWSDYEQRYPSEVNDGAIWSRPYEVELGTNIFDRYPLAYIYETEPPEVHLTNEDTVEYGDQIHLDATSSWDASRLTSFTWTITRGSDLNRTYTTQTDYLFYTPTSLWTHDVHLLVKDVWGNSAEASGEFTVIDDLPPVVYAGDDRVVDVGVAFDLNVLIIEENHLVRSIEWLVDPGGLNTLLHGPGVTLNIDLVGNFTVNLTVADMSGNVGTDSLVVYVLDRVSPVAIAGPPVVVGIQKRVAFDGSQSYDNVGIVKYTWSFWYDGWDHNIAGARIGFDFSVPGMYTVTLLVADASGNEASDFFKVMVRDTEAPVAHAGEDRFVNQGDPMTLTASGSSDNIGITRYQWQFYQDGSLATSGTFITIHFDDAGEYIVTLYVYDAENNWASDTVTVTVRDTESPIAVVWLPETLPIGTTIQLDGSYSSDNVEVVGYHWTVKFAGKLKTLNGPMAEFSFTSAGHYEISLTVRDAAGNEASDSGRIVVTPAGSDVPENAAWVIPLMAIVLIVVLIAGLILGPRVLKRNE